ncbi:methyl-accepting chemotaxis protein [Cytobacillus oceanisediminis]|uniref:methyl-accepting chemotaxis protein n=1 Tax=Cytobacillus oceanisediminis TaxID=665099 RepID=UPI001C218453|nr:HAMP domain-containing methyl-accepting chemotaxis protein [Cytobacillus oceanisediminis]MBU8732871.1 methyl-accepting chemotaxis protein [Cytobacillus oceanisediminis]
MKIKTKLLGIISILVCSLLLIGGSSIFVITSTIQKNEILKDKMEFQKKIKHIQYRLTGLSNDERGFIINGDKEFSDGMNKKSEDIFYSLQQLETIIHNQDYRRNVEEIQKNFNQYWDMNQKVLSQYSSSPEKAKALHFGEERNLRKEVLDPSVNELVDKLDNDVEDLKAEIHKYGSISKWFIGLVSTVSIILGVLFSIFLLRSILIPLSSLNKQLAEIAEGEADLTKEVDVKSKDEIGQLALSFNSFVGSLTNIIKQISCSSEQVAASSEELSASAEQSKATSDQIFQSMKEIALNNMKHSTKTDNSSKSVTEILESLSGIAENTSNIAEQSSFMKNKAETGASSISMVSEQMNLINRSVQEAGKGLDELVASTTEISHISSLITDISEQTNLLALNAAIEAARAGEHGKGFSVVATEVRKLADETNKSASHIKSLVETIQTESKDTESNILNVQENVQSGMSLAQDTSNQFREILNIVEQVTLQIQEVAAATQQLTAGVEVIQHTISTLAAGTKETSSSSEGVAIATQEQLGSMEEISSAATSLSHLAEDLQVIVNRFKY